MTQPKKSLGQHWLRDEATLSQIVALADLRPDDNILEIGPGLGDLTKLLVKKTGSVTAVEFDDALAVKLANAFDQNRLEIVSQDILKFDLTQLPAEYKVVANIPYYLTANLLRVLTESVNPPAQMVLLVQKEVAQRLAAGPGALSILAVSVQLDYDAQLGPVVPAGLFTPPPKVDSQVIKLTRRPQPLFDDLDRRLYLGIVKAGFSQRRKKLRSALAGGLHRSKAEVDAWLTAVGVNGDRRAQELSLDDWHQIYKRRYSAGGVIVGPDGRVVVVNQDDRTWSLPKGGLDPGEDDLAAARREIYEETGLTKLRLVKKLGSYERFAMDLAGEDLLDRPRYITMFLFTTEQTQLAPVDPANPEAYWVPPEKVASLLTHKKDKAFFEAVRTQL